MRSGRKEHYVTTAVMMIEWRKKMIVFLPGPTSLPSAIIHPAHSMSLINIPGVIDQRERPWSASLHSLVLPPSDLLYH